MATKVNGWKGIGQAMADLGHPYTEQWLRTLAKSPPSGCSPLPVYGFGPRGRKFSTLEGLAQWVETNRVHLSVRRAA